MPRFHHQLVQHEGVLASRWRVWWETENGYEHFGGLDYEYQAVGLAKTLEHVYQLGIDRGKDIEYRELQRAGKIP